MCNKEFSIPTWKPVTVESTSVQTQQVSKWTEVQQILHEQLLSHIYIYAL